MIGRTIRVAAAALALAAAACGELTGPSRKDVGTLSLRYEGAESGSFTARGARREEWSGGSHAAGLRYGPAPYVHVFAYRLESRGLARQVFLFGTVAGPGTYPFAERYGAGSFQAELALDVSSAQNSARAIYVFTSGTVTLEPERGDGRIRGRFQGTARLLNGAATIRVTDGRFDVPQTLPRPVE